MKTLNHQIENTKNYLIALTITITILFLSVTVKAQYNTSSTQNLYKQYRETLENGDQEEARRINEQIEKTIPKENLYKSIPDGEINISKRGEQQQQGDWIPADALVHNGEVQSLDYYRQIDMKMGEDGNMYIAVNSYDPPYSSRIDVYKSSNSGQDWTNVGWFRTSAYYYGSVKLLVENRSNNSNPDSTRIIVIYTKGTNSSLLNKLEFSSWRMDGDMNAFTYGEFATAPSGMQFSYISAVSDGAFFDASTYFGVVCIISGFHLHHSSETKLFRTINWGETWVGEKIYTHTGFGDEFPSADIKIGNGVNTDSVWIAVERYRSGKNIKVVATNWNPTPAIYTYDITDVSFENFERPCLTIKQNIPYDSAMITTTKNGEPFYFATTDAGEDWGTYLSLGDTYNGNNKSFTYCESSSNGDKPFVAMWQSDDGDSINLQRGTIGNMGETIYKRNSVTSSPSIMPVCIVFTPDINTNKAAFIYAGEAGVNVYADQEFIPGELTLKVIPEGFYRSGADKLKSSDVVTVYLRKISSPYFIKDSASAVINELTFTGVFHFYNIDQGDYFIAVKHRNSIETWSSESVHLGEGETASYDFTASASSAYGNNMKQISISPVRFGIFSGDVDQNGTIDVLDLGLTDNDAINFVTGYVPTDVNGDMTVDAADLSIIDNNAFNYVSSVTPPLSAAMNSINNTGSREVSLSQNYPNPFNPSTKISFNLPQESNVKLAIYDMRGREIATLVNTRLTAGNHQYDWNASSFASGVYFFKITAGNFSVVKKMNLIK